VENWLSHHNRSLFSKIHIDFFQLWYYNIYFFICKENNLNVSNNESNNLDIIPWLLNKFRLFEILLSNKYSCQILRLLCEGTIHTWSRGKTYEVTQLMAAKRCYNVIFNFFNVLLHEQSCICNIIRYDNIHLWCIGVKNEKRLCRAN